MKEQIKKTLKNKNAEDNLVSGTVASYVADHFTHIDLFSGIGGFALAAKMVFGEQYENLAFCEIEPFCQEVLRANFGKGINLIDDVKKLNGENFGTVKLITGGFPCQDISIAQRGNRSGLAGERSGLWFEFARIIDETHPEWVIIENVPRLLTSNDGRDFATIIQTLVEFGYGVCWRLLDARYFGVAGTRKRIFIVARFGDLRSAREVLFEQSEICGVLQKPKAKPDIKPMCVGWDGGLTFERLRECILTKTNPIRTGESDGVPRQLDKYRYRALGNAIVPQVAMKILAAIKKTYMAEAT